MDIREIKKILEMMKENDLSEFEMEDQGFRLALKRRSGEVPLVMAAPMAAPAVPAAVAAAAPAPAAAAPKDEDADLIPIKSPIVGTFYRAASPDAEPYVSVGQEVDENTVVCIVEAMKVFNQIPAEIGGKIVAVLVENGEPVEFGQPLFKVDTRQ